MTEKLRILEALKGERIKCAYVKVGFFDSEWRDESNFKNREVVSLPVGYTTEQYNTFLEILDKDSDFRCGEREVFGTIWLDNNHWLYKDNHIEEDVFHAPNEQDKEWLMRTPPPIPKQLLTNN
jgi:hypothetical protein